jgi:ribosomal protein S18 acetylase RimI-like enzyme
MAPLVRIATPKDLPSLVALYEQLNPGDVLAPQEHLASVFNEIISGPYFEFLVAELEDKVVGTCYLNVVPNLSRSASPYAVIENVVVARNLRRRGIGRAVVSFALARAWERGCYKVMLQTGSQSEATYQFYRSCGFSQTEKVAFVARPHGAMVANLSLNRTARRRRSRAGRSRPGSLVR